MEPVEREPLGDIGAGNTVGRYELLLPIAQGGMAVVWAARMKGTRGFQKIVAVKSMLPALSEDSQFEEMFLAEAELASQIRHPNVCEILDLGEQNGALYIVMEWVDGEPLSALQRAVRHAARDANAHGASAPDVTTSVAGRATPVPASLSGPHVALQGAHPPESGRSPSSVPPRSLAALGSMGGPRPQPPRPQGMPMAVATRIAFHAANGLHAAHELTNDAGELVGLVHRDVSPQNILVTHGGVVKIVDFGVAKATSSASEARTQTGQVKGKIPFMSPEQARGAEVDRRTDVFALGIVLYQALTGKHPFRGDTDIATLAAICEGGPLAPPSTFVPGCPSSLDAAILRALEKDPAKRFQTMLEFARALDKALADLAQRGEDQDLGAFVRAMLGEKSDKRRAAIKDALRLADQRTEERKREPAGRLQDAIEPPPTEISHITITSGVGTPGNGVPGFPTVTGGSGPPSAATGEAYTVPGVPTAGEGRGKKIAAAVIVAAVAILGIAAAAFVVLRRGDATVAHHAPSSTLGAEPTVPSPPPPPPATAASTLAPSTVASASASAPTASASAWASQPGGSRAGTRPRPTATAAASAVPAATASNLPRIRNPGF